MISALEIHGVPVECINQAAIAYHVPATLILSVLAVEGGAVGLASANKNGTVDYGPMQINSIWLSKIRLYGYTQHQLQYDPCVNVKVGAWILSQNIANAATTWRGVGSYHSHTAILNQQYQTKVSEVYQLLANYLS
ncbi:MAG: Soluble lytic murein transglycosylase and related regulatory protein [Pseudomonadota bacterium]|jgi:soluble lytic murein transglycosylase-like protein